jgi:membrane protease YdiL (CAAX protease family)
MKYGMHAAAAKTRLAAAAVHFNLGENMKTFIDYLLGGLFAAAMGFGLALIYIYKTGGF